MQDLSPRQAEILDFIIASIDQSGVAPSYREIGAALGIRSTNGVSDHIKALVRKGYLERVGGGGRPRSLRLTPLATGMSEDAVVGVPLVGRIAAGAPLLAHESYEGTVRIDSSFLPSGGRIFALRVQGESMIEDGIFDGDTLFVRQQPSARDGEIAVVMVEDEATVKRLYYEDGLLRLEPSNAFMDPIYVDPRASHVQVIGVAVGVFRKL